MGECKTQLQNSRKLEIHKQENAGDRRVCSQPDSQMYMPARYRQNDPSRSGKKGARGCEREGVQEKHHDHDLHNDSAAGHVAIPQSDHNQDQLIDSMERPLASPYAMIVQYLVYLTGLSPNKAYVLQQPLFAVIVAAPLLAWACEKGIFKESGIKRSGLSELARLRLSFPCQDSTRTAVVHRNRKGQQLSITHQIRAIHPLNILVPKLRVRKNTNVELSWFVFS